MLKVKAIRDYLQMTSHNVWEFKIFQIFHPESYVLLQNPYPKTNLFAVY